MEEVEDGAGQGRGCGVGAWHFFLSTVPLALPSGLTSDDECVALSPQLALREALTGLWVLRVEEVVEEISSAGVENVTIGSLADLFPAEGQVLIAIFVQLSEKNPVKARLMQPRHWTGLWWSARVSMFVLSTPTVL